MARIWCVVVVVIAAVLCGCGGTDKAALTGALDTAGALPAQSGLSALPADGVQPWESVDSRGYVVPHAAGSGGAGIPARDTDGQEWPSHRSTSAFPSSSEFALGVERFSEGGNATDNGAATKLIADFGATPLSYALYRFTMAGSQPGAVAVDANLNIGLHGKLSQYWVGVSDYGENAWQWHGPFTDAQVALTLASGDYTSSLGNTFIAVAVHGGSDLDVIGVTVSADDTADTTAPPAPGSAPLLTPVASGIEAEWLPVIAGDLAGYRVYWSYSPFTAASDNGVQAVEWLENTTRIVLPATTGRMTWVGISAVDVNGNESALSPVASAQRLSNETAPLLYVGVSPVSALRGENVTLSIIPQAGTAIDSLDIDLDGDGVFEITGTTVTGHTVPTDATGIIRPRVRASNADGTAVALGSVSLIVTGNQRPVANAQCTPQTGVAPLDVDMNGTGEDFDGTIADYAWDFDGDGIYDHNSPADGITSETYAVPGLYNAKLRVTDDQGAWDVDTVSILVTSGVHIDAVPDYAQPGQQVTLTATPPPGGLAGYEWDLDNDGVYETDTGPANSVTTSFTVPGNQVVGVLVDMAEGPDATGATTLRVAGWRIANTHAHEPESEGDTLNMAMINGKPAVTYIDITASAERNLIYVRATDPEGLNWGTPVTVATNSSGQYAGAWPALAEINGRPAIAGGFQGAPNSDLRFWRANDAGGSSWGSGVVIDSSLTNIANLETEMIELESTPPLAAVAFRHPGGTVRYARALSADGSSWAPPTLVDNSSTLSNVELVVAAGNPALAYARNSTEIYYVRGVDDQGITFGTPTLVQMGTYPSLTIVAGHPAVSAVLLSGSTYYVSFRRASDAIGSIWGATILAASSPTNLLDTKLVQSGGIPFIFIARGSTWDSVRAQTPLGSTWGTPGQVIGPNTSNYFLEAADVNGSPGFAAAHGIADNDVVFGRLY